jgi:uncharacterized protein YcgL (UPF0745 family)
MYIYIAEEDDFSAVPPEIMKAIGTTSLAMELDITPETRLAREDAAIVLQNIEVKGFHLQLPSTETVETIMARIAKRD